MDLAQLKKQAAKILDLEPGEGFQHVTFRTGSGGPIRNKVGVPIIHQDSEFRYNTVANGAAVAGSVTIECRSTGAKDANGRTIYVTPCGKVFVYAYSSGSAYNFDCGSLVDPKM